MRSYKSWPSWVKIVTAPISIKNKKTPRYYYVSSLTVFAILVFLEFVKKVVLTRYFMIALVILSLLQGLSMQWINKNSAYEVKESNSRYLVSGALFIFLISLLLVGAYPELLQGWRD